MRLGVLVLIGVACASHGAYGQATFRGLGDLPGGDFESYAVWVSDEGTAVGSSEAAEGNEAFIHTPETGLVGRGLFQDPPASSTTRRRSYLVSGNADGTVFVGGSVIGSEWDAVRHSIDGTSILLERIDPSFGQNYAREISADGRTIVGTSRFTAVIWDEAGNLRPLGTLEGTVGPSSSYGYAISADGSRVAGRFAANRVVGSFLWSDETGMQSLGVLPGGATGDLAYSEAGDLSADGTVVVGFARGVDRLLPYRWTADQGMVSLGSFDDEYLDWNVTDLFHEISVSADGSVTVGRNGYADGAFIHTDELGMQRLSAFLRAMGGDLEGWRLSAATSISPDGRYIAGYGLNPAGQTEAWIAVIPEPSPALLLCAGLGLLSRRRKGPLRAFQPAACDALGR